MQSFIEQIKKNLEKNGFPDKRVSLPTEKMYEIADQKDLSFNTVLKELREKYEIDSEVGPDKIVFSKKAAPNFEGIDPEMMQKAQDMMSKMDPEQLAKIQEQVMNMSDEERQEILKKAQTMGGMFS